MSGDVQVRFCEKLGVKFPRLTRLSDTPAGAHASAMLYSVIETAKANNVEPYAYLQQVIEQLPKATSVEEISALLPYNFSKPNLQ